MTQKEIEEAAQQHADRHYFQDMEVFFKDSWPEAQKRYAKQLSDFAKFCASRQWISVDDRLPEADDFVLVFVPADFAHVNRYEVAYWDGEDWYTSEGEHIRPDYWMEIPHLIPKENADKA